MLAPRYRVLRWIGPLIGLGPLLIVAIQSEPQPKPWEYVTIGLVYGTFFGHATLAAAWTALGPLPLVWRLPLSLGWLAALIAALAVNMSVHGPGDDAEILAIFGCVILGQWAVAQTPMWGLSIGYGVRLRYTSDADAATDRNERQFGIRQVMVVTAIVAIVLGIGRVLIPALVKPDVFAAGPLIIIAFLAGTGIVMMLPLLLAALLPRLAVPTSLLMLILIGLGTAAELPLLTAINRVPGGGPNSWHFYGINGFQAAWVLALAGSMRLGGYRLSVPIGPRDPTNP
jgi:hypothetical protein